MVIQQTPSYAPRTAPVRASSGAVDRFIPAPEQPQTLEAARKLFTVDPSVACHVQATVAIDDLREHNNTYFYPPTPVFTPSGKLIVGTNKGDLIAFQGEKELWRVPTGVVSAYNDPTCTQDGRLLFCNRKTPELLCLKEDGTQDFKLDLPAPLFSDLQFDSKGNTYACTETVLVALDPRGNELWRRDVPEFGAAVLTTPDDRVLLYTEERGLSQLDARGQEVWSYPGRLVATPAFAPDNTMFLATEDGVQVVRPDGSARQAEALPGKPSFLEADALGNVIVVTENAHVVSLSSEGKIRKQRQMWQALPSAPTVQADGTVLLGMVNSDILRLDSDLEVVGAYGITTNKPGERVSMKTPRVAPDGSLYVDQGGNKLDVLSPEGRPAFTLEGFHRSSPTFSADGVLAVAHWDKVYLLKERTMQEVLAEKTEETSAKQVERRGDFLVVGGSMVRVRKPRW